MSATEEFRKMLDERGVEWRKPAQEYWVLLGMPEGDSSTIVGELSIEEATDGTLVAYNLTPEQAIEATLGAGTCHYIPDDVGFTWWDENDVEHCEEYSASYECGSASCDKCGYKMMVGDEGWFDGWDEITEWWEEDGSYHKGYVLRPRFKHCPNCGRKVVDE